MKKTIFLLIVASCIITGCAATKSNKQSVVRQISPYNVTLVIPPAKSSNDIMIALSSVSTSDQVFPNSRGKNIEGLGIASVKIESSDPSKKNLGMFKSIKIFLSNGAGSSEVLIASNNSISPYIGSRLTLNVDFDKSVDLGYSAVKRKDVTGSMASLNADEMEGIPVTRADQAMVGKLAGVQVQKSGEPGSPPQVIIRGGANSLSKAGSPLYVVDGFPVDNIAMLNPNDIESLDVLKDVSLTSMYGMRGSNGVIIVTTKTGNSDFKKNEGSLDNFVKGSTVRTRVEYVMRYPLGSETAININIDFK